MRLKHKAWFFRSAALGLAVPIGIHVYGRLMMLAEVSPFEVPPFVQWLFWPTSLLMDFGPWTALRWEGVFILLLLLGNALLYGLLAAVLRRASIGIAALLLVVAWIALPPGDNTLVKRFRKHRVELENLVQMANHDAQFAAIGPDLVKMVDGKKYGPDEVHRVLSDARWGEYQRLFNSVGLNAGLNRDERTGDVFLAAHTFGKTDSVATYFGFLYCPDATGRVYGFTPCVDGSDAANKRLYRWKKLDSGWYIFEIRVRGIE